MMKMQKTTKWNLICVIQFFKCKSDQKKVGFWSDSINNKEDLKIRKISKNKKDWFVRRVNMFCKWKVESVKCKRKGYTCERWTWSPWWRGRRRRRRADARPRRTQRPHAAPPRARSPSISVNHTFIHSHIHTPFNVLNSLSVQWNVDTSYIVLSIKDSYLLCIRINNVGHVVTVVEFGQNVVSLFWIRKIPVLCYPSVHLLSL